jgi:hypothetical protein
MSYVDEVDDPDAQPVPVEELVPDEEKEAEQPQPPVELPNAVPEAPTS